MQGTGYTCPMPRAMEVFCGFFDTNAMVNTLFTSMIFARDTIRVLQRAGRQLSSIVARWQVWRTANVNADNIFTVAADSSSQLKELWRPPTDCERLVGDGRYLPLHELSVHCSGSADL
jgi:hypothetical protein